MCPEASNTYLNVGDTEYRDCLNLILARSGWLQLIQRCKEAVKIIHSGHRHRHDARPTLLSPLTTRCWIWLRSTAVSPSLQATDVTRSQQEESVRGTALQASVTDVMPISVCGRVVSVEPRILMSTATLLTHPQWVRDAPTSLPGEVVLIAAIVRPVRSTKDTVCGIVERLSMELLKTSGGEVGVEGWHCTSERRLCILEAK